MVSFAFMPKLLSLQWGLMNTIHHSVSVDEVVVILKGDEDILNHSIDVHDFNDHRTHNMVWM